MKTTHKSVSITVPIEVTVHYRETLSLEGQDVDGNRGYYERECEALTVEVETAGIPADCQGWIKAMALDQFERDYA